MALISAQTVSDQLGVIAAWTDAQAHSEVEGFTERQPIVSAYLFATLEDEGREPTGFALQIALLIDLVYQRVLGRAPRRITPRLMEAAAADAEKGFEQLVGVEPDLALRRMLFQRDLAEPELLVELIRLLMEEGMGDAALDESLGVIFLATKALALAYERANGLAPAVAAKGSLGEAIEAQLGHPLPKIGRNEPCPCGSGRKFKKCCGRFDPVASPEDDISPDSMLGDSEAEQRFLVLMTLVEGCMALYHDLGNERDGRWLQQRNSEFERRFQPGKLGGVPDSLHMGYLLFDLTLPGRGKSVGQLLLEGEGRKLIEPDPTFLGHLCDSYPAFYELIETRPDEGSKRLRELVTGSEWTVADVDDPDAELGDAGEIWLCRLVGPSQDAVTFMSPLLFEPEARAGIEQLVRDLIEPELTAGLPLADALRAGMKREVPSLAEFLVATAGAEDEE